MGRPTGYDADEMMRSVADMFRRRPLHAVSVRDIVDSTGINRFAIYEKFGGKEGLYYACLDFYLEVAVKRELLRAFQGDCGTFDDLLALLRSMRELNLDPATPAGCLIVDASIEHGSSDPRVAQIAEKYRAVITEAVTRALRQLNDQGRLCDGRSLEERADYLVTVMSAFMMVAHVSRVWADKLIAALTDEVTSWRLAP